MKQYYAVQVIGYGKRKVYTVVKVTEAGCSPAVPGRYRTEAAARTAAEPGNYAQYSGVYLTIKRGRKDARIFCRDGIETVIFPGLPCSLPDSVKYASVKASGGANIAECRSQGDEMRQIIRFYAEMGRKPIFDTVQR